MTPYLRRRTYVLINLFWIAFGIFQFAMGWLDGLSVALIVISIVAGAFGLIFAAVGEIQDRRRRAASPPASR